MTKTIAYKNLPARPPILLTAVTWLGLDRVDAPGWAWGIAITLLVLIWIAQVVGMVKEVNVDLFAGGAGGEKSCTCWRCAQKTGAGTIVPPPAPVGGLAAPAAPPEVRVVDIDPTEAPGIEAPVGTFVSYGRRLYVKSGTARCSWSRVDPGN
mgnify:CR=1 FL=1